jgi:FkbM family methyltransferase
MFEVREVNTKTGNMLVHSDDPIIGRSLIDYGEYCWQEIELIRDHVGHGDFVIDIGAGIGTHSIALSPIVSRVLLMEPDKENFDLLTKNLGTNMCRNVTAHNMAMGAETKKIATKFNFSKSTINNGGDIMMTTLDSIKGFPPLSLIKISANGMELPILMGAMQTLSYFKCQVIVDVSDASSKPFILDYLKGLNYNVYEFNCPLFTSANHRKNPKNIFEDMVKSTYFATFNQPNRNLKQV